MMLMPVGAIEVCVAWRSRTPLTAWTLVLQLGKTPRCSAKSLEASLASRAMNSITQLYAFGLEIKYPVGLRPTSHGHRECPIRAFLSPEHSNVDGVPFLSSGKQYPRQMDSLFPSQAKTYCMEVVCGLFWATTYLTN